MQENDETQGETQGETPKSPINGQPVPNGHETQFKPGQSGNPAGHSKERRFQKALWEYLDSHKDDLPATMAELMTHCKKGSPAHIRVASEISDGKPQQEHSIKTSFEKANVILTIIDNADTSESPAETG